MNNENEKTPLINRIADGITCVLLTFITGQHIAFTYSHSNRNPIEIIMRGETQFRNTGGYRIEWEKKTHKNEKLVEKTINCACVCAMESQQSPEGIKNEWKELATFTSTLVMHHLCVALNRNTGESTNRLFCYFDSIHTCFCLKFWPRLWFLIARLFCVRSSRLHRTMTATTTTVTVMTERRDVWRWFY